MNLKHFVLIVGAIVFADSALAESPIRKKRIKSAQTNYQKKLKEIQNAFDAENYDKARTMLNNLELDAAASKGKLHQFHTYLSLGYLTEAEKLAYDLLDDNEFSYIERAQIHNALGSAYFVADDLDGALSQFKKILELYEKNQ